MRSLLILLVLLIGTFAPAKDVDPKLARIESWTEAWPDENGVSQSREVRGEIWNDAIAEALAEHHEAYLPKRQAPYYLDGPVILKSGEKLTADRDAEIRLKPGTNTCMVRNENILGFSDRPVPSDTQPDSNITVEGGIWTTLATSPREFNGNARGASSRLQPVTGTHGVILLHNVRQVTVRQVTIRQSRAFGVHLANAQDFLVENIRLDRHGRDGVHVNGPASQGIIRDVSGDSRDDTVSIAAWDWQNYTSSFGPIHDLLIEDISGVPDKAHSTDAIRLLPGTKRFADGSFQDCTISNVVLRDLRNIIEFKFYNQPNLEHGRDVDASATIGMLRNIRLEDLVFDRPGSIQIHTDVEAMTVDTVLLNFPPLANYSLIEVGPKSQTYKHKAGDPATWVEIFSPDLDCTVRGLRVSGVRRESSGAELPVTEVVRVIEQKVNPDYPRTVPKGGTGKGIWVR